MDEKMEKHYTFNNGFQDQLFSVYTIKWKEIFLSSSLCFSFVNYKPVVPGHVLICPKRIVQKFGELKKEELTDMMLMAQKVGHILQIAFGSASFSFVIQDGKEAGQTVPHVHLHIMPRSENDFEPNDEIYAELEKTDLSHFKETTNKKDKNLFRTLEEMAKEAAMLREIAITTVIQNESEKAKEAMPREIATTTVNKNES